LMVIVRDVYGFNGHRVSCLTAIVNAHSNGDDDRPDEHNGPRAECGCPRPRPFSAKTAENSSDHKTEGGEYAECLSEFSVSQRSQNKFWQIYYKIENDRRKSLYVAPERFCFSAGTDQQDALAHRVKIEHRGRYRKQNRNGEGSLPRIVHRCGKDRTEIFLLNIM